MSITTAGIISEMTTYPPNNNKQSLYSDNPVSFSKMFITSLLDYTDLRENIETTEIYDIMSRVSSTPCHVAGFCVNPSNVLAAVKARNHFCKDIKIVSVAGGFPTSYLETKDVASSVRESLQNGADEIDLVFDRDSFFDKNYETCINKIKESKKLCAKTGGVLKIILETSEFERKSDLGKACLLSVLAGGDFLKTSTGTTAKGATINDVEIMCDVIRYCQSKYNIISGIKPSGGIKTVQQCTEILNVIYRNLGKNWMNPSLTRIGASGLFNQLTKTQEDYLELHSSSY